MYVHEYKSAYADVHVQMFTRINAYTAVACEMVSAYARCLAIDYVTTVTDVI